MKTKVGLTNYGLWTLHHIKKSKLTIQSFKDYRVDNSIPKKLKYIV